MICRYCLNPIRFWHKKLNENEHYNCRSEHYKIFKELNNDINKYIVWRAEKAKEDSIKIRNKVKRLQYVILSFIPINIILMTIFFLKDINLIIKKEYLDGILTIPIHLGSIIIWCFLYYNSLRTLKDIRKKEMKDMLELLEK